MQESVFLSAKINKCRLNSRLNIYDFPFIDIAHMADQIRSLGV